MEWNDIYDKDRNLTGRVHRRGTPWRKGEYGLVVCVWVHDGKGKLLLTKRAPEKSFPGTWENTGGSVKAGEYSRQAIARELYEETGIRAEETEFELLDSGCDGNTHYDYYYLERSVPLEDVVLQPGETVDAKWATYEEVRGMIRRNEICHVIAKRFLRQEKDLLARRK